MKIEITSGNDEISGFRRILPQILATIAKNLIIFNLGEFAAFPSIVIPSLIGVCSELNPDETLRITAAETSWLSSFAHVAHPIGSLLSGPICDRIGRRNAIMMVTIPLTLSWLMLSFAHSFFVICLGFASIGFCMGLKESPSITYVSEISEPSVRGMMSTIAVMSYNFGIFIVLGFGLIFSWRKVAMICALFPLSCLVAVMFVPESPSWLLLKDRSSDAQKSLQWLRGWASPNAISDEFQKLQNYSKTSNACNVCTKKSVSCIHPKPTFCDKIKELKRKRTLKAVSLVFSLHFFFEFCAIVIWQPYIIQVLKAFGTPINANLTTVISAGLGISASIFLICTVKTVGRRKLYLTSISIVTLCSFGLSIYGFIFFPSGWTSFRKVPDDGSNKYEDIRQIVGNYSYVALALVLTMQFATKFGVAGMPHMFVSEVFPLKSRSFLCGIATANQYFIASIATKTYYNIEMWLTLSGAIMFYATISFIGLIVMYFILPETEGGISLEDIELHYSDNEKGITDIHISKQSSGAFNK